jgi:hypothetical protein
MGTLGRVAAVAAIGLIAAGTVHGAHATGPSTASANERLGMRMAAAAGWDRTQRHCLNELWTRESNWRDDVWNTQGSGAYGIPQARPASKMASAGPDYMTDPATQVRWGIRYIRAAYGSPCNAWAQETASGGY